MKGLSSIASTTAEQAQREPIYYLIIFPFAALAFLIRYLVLFVFEGEAQVLIETGLVTVGACGIILALFLSWILVRKEMERMSVLMVLTKPVSNTSFVLGKYIGLAVAIFKALLLVFIMFLISLWQSRSTGIISSVLETVPLAEMAPGFSSGGADWIVLYRVFTKFFIEVSGAGLQATIGVIPLLFRVFIVLSVAVVASLFFRILPVSGIVVGYVLLSGLSGTFFAALTETSSILWTGIGWGIRLLIPDFQMLNIANIVVGSSQQYSEQALWYFLGLTCLSGLVYILMWLSVGVFLFQKKEIK